MEFSKLLVLTLALVAITCTAVEAQGQILRCFVVEKSSEDSNPEPELSQTEEAELHEVSNPERSYETAIPWKRAEMAPGSRLSKLLMGNLPKRFDGDDYNLRLSKKIQLPRNKNVVNVAFPNERKMLPRLF